MPFDWRPIAGVIVGLLAVWALLILLLWLFRPRDVRLREMLRVVPDVLRLVRGLLGDRSVPFGVRVALVVLLAWLVSPIDLIPEFIPVIGPLDDVVVTVLVLRYVRGRLGDAELKRRWLGTPEGYALLMGSLGGAS
jgi:uncharacterized membrane protein YkvA (DUF1232 family)